MTDVTCGLSHKIRIPRNAHKSGLRECGFAVLWDCVGIPAILILEEVGKNQFVLAYSGNSYFFANPNSHKRFENTHSQNPDL